MFQCESSVCKEFKELNMGVLIDHVWCDRANILSLVEEYGRLNTVQENHFNDLEKENIR